MSMSVTDLFEGLKKKKYRTAFALYSPAEDDLPPEVQKWYLDFTNPAVAISATWRESGIVSVEQENLSSYMDSWAEYCRCVKDARVNSIGWSNKRADAVKKLGEATDRNGIRFWTSALGVLDFWQVDTRML